MFKYSMLFDTAGRTLVCIYLQNENPILTLASVKECVWELLLVFIFIFNWAVRIYTIANW